MCSRTSKAFARAAVEKHTVSQVTKDRTGIRRSPERKRKHEHAHGIDIWAGAGLAFWRVAGRQRASPEV